MSLSTFDSCYIKNQHPTQLGFIIPHTENVSNTQQVRIGNDPRANAKLKDLERSPSLASLLFASAINFNKSDKS